MPDARDVLVTGGTGYVGRALSKALLGRGHRVRVLARQVSLSRVVAGAQPVVGDALNVDSVVGALRYGDVLVHLVGTPHPGPGKAAAFQQVDLTSIRSAVAAATKVGVAQFVYVSVAQPAPVMRAFIDARAQGEQLIADAGLTASVLRPWYVLGPVHWWPIVLLPVYAIATALPTTRQSARRLGLVTLRQMVTVLVVAVEDPPPAGAVRVIDVPAIRSARAS